MVFRVGGEIIVEFFQIDLEILYKYLYDFRKPIEVHHVKRYARHDTYEFIFELDGIPFGCVDEREKYQPIWYDSRYTNNEKHNHQHYSIEQIQSTRLLVQR